MSCLLLIAAGSLLAAETVRSPGAPAAYVGGTVVSLGVGEAGMVRLADESSFVFETRGSAVRIPYERINLIEYGQKVDRRVLEAIVISPLMMLAKKRAHFLTVGFETEQGKQQALLLRVDKNHIRAVLVSLEARTGLRVTYQDEEARKAGKG